MKTRYLDHIDLRVKNMARAREFYRKLLPALGFTRERAEQEWTTFYAPGRGRTEAFFGFTEERDYQPNATRISFWANDRAEVDQIAALVGQSGGKSLEGPELCAEYTPGYYAFFFEDPDGNKLEICSRENPIIAE